MTPETITAVGGVLVGVVTALGAVVQTRRTGQREREEAARAAAQQLLDESEDYRRELRAERAELAAELGEVKRQLVEQGTRLLEVQRENVELLVEVAALRTALERAGVNVSGEAVRRQRGAASQ